MRTRNAYRDRPLGWSTLGTLTLTDSRLIWTPFVAPPILPFDVFTWIAERQEVRRVSVERGWMMWPFQRWGIRIETSDSTAKFDWAGWAAAQRRAEEWLQAIREWAVVW